MKEGKKEHIKRLDLMPTNKEYKCTGCRNDLVKLRTESDNSKGSKQYNYWICICTDEQCEMNFKYVKVLFSISKIIGYPLIGRYVDRGNTSGR